MARSTMVTLIDELRDLASVGTADWTDDQLQTVLDRRRRHVWREHLAMNVTYNGGTAFYYEYQSAYRHYEDTDGGTAAFVVEDSNGDARGTATYTPSYVDGRITFSVDQAGTSLYLTGRAYDLYGAAAQVCRQQAGALARKFDFTADGKTFKRSQQYTHYMGLAKQYDAMSTPVSGLTELVRTDVIG